MRTFPSRIQKFQYEFAYQHGGTQIELMKELRYKYVNFKHIRNVFSLNISENVNKPFEMFMRWADP